MMDIIIIIIMGIIIIIIAKDRVMDRPKKDSNFHIIHQIIIKDIIKLIGLAFL